MNQNELASRAGIAHSTLSGIEAGKHVPPVDIAIRLSRILKCNVEDLFIEPDGWLEK